MNENPAQSNWYRRWWGLGLIVCGVLFGAGVLATVGLGGYYWWQIKSGNFGTLPPELHGAFSLAPKTDATAKTSSKVNRAELEVVNRATRGLPGALLTVVEFIDFKCPNCLVQEPILKQVISKYGNSVHLIVRQFPVESTHPGATELSEIAVCAGEQGRYWPVHDYLYSHQNNLSVPMSAEEVADLVEHAGLNVESLVACRANGFGEQKVRVDYFDGLRFGVRGTPTFFFNGVKVEGVVPFASWQKIFDSQ